jgi:threonine/homoserine/homoserine lactone efflux protein
VSRFKEGTACQEEHIMTLATLLAYSGALFIAAAIPGPGVTAIVARALGSGFRETFFMGLGLILGDMLYLTAVVLGLAFIAQTFTTAFLAVKIAGALYLIYIAWKLWTGGLLPQEVEARKSASATMSFLSGLMVTLGNPKTMLFYVALVPTLIDLASVGIEDYGLLLAATFLVLLTVLLPYMLLAARARSLLKQPKALKAMNRAAAGILAGTAAYIATRAT